MKPEQSAVDFSTPEGKEMFESEVQKRMAAPFHMTRDQASMLVAVLLTPTHSATGDQT